MVVEESEKVAVRNLTGNELVRKFQDVVVVKMKRDFIFQILFKILLKKTTTRCG